jgi:hypothetical protein
MIMAHTQLKYLSCISNIDRAMLLETLSARGFTAIIFNGAMIKNGPDLMNQVGLQLGLQKEMIPKSWDALRDALFEVMTTAGGDQVAMVWDDSDHMLSADLQDFLQATTILQDVAVATLRTQKADSYFFLLGELPGYRRLDLFLKDI